MFSVSAMAAQAKQPNGGYLPVSLFRTLEYDDGNTTPSISAEYAGAVGTVVDYMTRFIFFHAQAFIYQQWNV